MSELSEMYPRPGLSIWECYVNECEECGHVGIEGIPVTKPYPMDAILCPSCESPKFNMRLRKPGETNDPEIRKWLFEKWEGK